MKRSPLVLAALALALVVFSACAPSESAAARAGPTTTLASPTLGAALPPPTASGPVLGPEALTPAPLALTSAPMAIRDPADWPMFRFSLDRTGYNPTEVTLKPPLKLVWRFKAGAKI